MYTTDFFDGADVLAYAQTTLQHKNAQHVGNQIVNVPERVAIMTHDDNFDAEMHDEGLRWGIAPTFFLFDDANAAALPSNAHIQFHYRMDGPPLEDQVRRFEDAVQKTPIANRNHRAFWRANHLNLLHLQMQGFLLDCSLQGTDAFRLCVDGRLLDIVELPYAIVDDGYVSATHGIFPTYNIAATSTNLFAAGVSPLVGLFHPQHKQHTNWKNFYRLASCFGYTLTSVEGFYAAYC